MRYHIDTSAQSLAIYTLTDLADGTINLNDGIFRLDGAVSFAGGLPYGSTAAMALAVIQEFLLHLASPEPDTSLAVRRMRNRLIELSRTPIATESTDPAAVSFDDALANQGEFWAGVE